MLFCPLIAARSLRLRPDSCSHNRVGVPVQPVQATIFGRSPDHHVSCTARTQAEIDGVLNTIRSTVDSVNDFGAGDSSNLALYSCLCRRQIDGGAEDSGSQQMR